MAALVAFRIQVPPTTRAVHLFGSWDAFQKPHPMSADTAKGAGHWHGAFPGLKLGGSYTYYYILDSRGMMHDPSSRQVVKDKSGRTLSVIHVPATVAGAQVVQPAASAALKAQRARVAQQQQRYAANNSPSSGSSSESSDCDSEDDSSCTSSSCSSPDSIAAQAAGAAPAASAAASTAVCNCRMYSGPHYKSAHTAEQQAAAYKAAYGTSDMAKLTAMAQQMKIRH